MISAPSDSPCYPDISSYLSAPTGPPVWRRSPLESLWTERLERESSTVMLVHLSTDTGKRPGKRPGPCTTAMSRAPQSATAVNAHGMLVARVLMVANAPRPHPHSIFPTPGRNRPTCLVQLGSGGRGGRVIPPPRVRTQHHFNHDSCS